MAFVAVAADALGVVDPLPAGTIRVGPGSNDSGVVHIFLARRTLLLRGGRMCETQQQNERRLQSAFRCRCPVRQTQSVSIVWGAIQRPCIFCCAPRMPVRSRALEGPLRQLANGPRPYSEQAETMLKTLAGLLHGTSVHRRRMKFIGGLRKGHKVYLPRWRRDAVIKKVDRVREIAVVEYGKLRMEVPFEDVSWLRPLDDA